MAATVIIHSFHDASPTGADITGTEVRFKRADNDTVDVNNPVPVPAAGENYSWRKYTKIRVSSGIGTQIGNIRWFADTAPGNWAGTVSLYAGVTPSYTQPASANESSLGPGLLDANTYTTSAPLTVNASAAAITQNSSYGSQDYVMQQIGVKASTPAGVKTARSCTYRYDEI